jgi:hypothetical protein
MRFVKGFLIHSSKIKINEKVSFTADVLIQPCNNHTRTGHKRQNQANLNHSAKSPQCGKQTQKT